MAFIGKCGLSWMETESALARTNFRKLPPNIGMILHWCVSAYSVSV